MASYCNREHQKFDWKLHKVGQLIDYFGVIQDYVTMRRCHGIWPVVCVKEIMSPIAAFFDLLVGKDAIQWIVECTLLA